MQHPNIIHQQGKVLRSSIPNMIDFITEKGWVFFAPCGCRTAMNKYKNKGEKFKDYEIWISKQMNSFQIRIVNGRSFNTLRSGNAASFEITYNNYFDSI